MAPAIRGFELDRVARVGGQARPAGGSRGFRDSRSSGALRNVLRVPAQVSPDPPSTRVVNGDPTVISALALGWEMSGLYAARKSEAGEMKLPENLPSESDLRHRQRVDAGIAKVAVLIERVLAAPAQPSDPPPSTDALCNGPTGKRSDWEKAVYDLHIELVVALRANDMALFHAYDLGRSLARHVPSPGGPRLSR